MKTKLQLKKPYGAGAFSRIKHARYLSWEDAFDVEFDDGLCFLEPHPGIRKANGVSGTALPVSVEVDSELGSHFTVTYDTGEKAEVSWSFVRELAPSRRERADHVLISRHPTRRLRVAEEHARYGHSSKPRQRRRLT